ncbi:MAG: phosphotransferase [Opitutaceae bacterium]|nr:phosphotransferase [Opitutaceae bacterium]
MSSDIESDPRAALCAAGLIGVNEQVELLPLTGGVSSDIMRVRTTTGRQFVIKQALAKLKVKAAWFANTDRNRVEQAYFAYTATLVPSMVPQLLHSGDTWFAMEYLDDGFMNWKTELLAGRANLTSAKLAGAFLGQVHRASWDNAAVRTEFATDKNFHDLRIEPYLLTTGLRLPALQSLFEVEAKRLGGSKQALVHGDYSPKNMLVSTDRMFVLDAEVAWFGDPAFDLAFLLTHLHLKILVNVSNSAPTYALIPTFWDRYCTTLGKAADAALEGRTCRLILMLMLARVHGKSPAEYLSTDQQQTVTDFASAGLLDLPRRLSALTTAWMTALTK